MKNKPMKHQETGLELSRNKRNFAFLMEQGTGKTYLTLADVERLFKARLINALMVVAPNGVHSNWVLREIPKHMDMFVISHYWQTQVQTLREGKKYEALFANHYPSNTQPLRVFAINIDALNAKKGFAAAERFLKEFKVLMVVDESSRIKNPYAIRTKKAIRLGRQATARRILNGTPITKAPTDLFSQFEFLDHALLGTSSYRAFVSEFSVLLPDDDDKMRAIKRKMVRSPELPQIVAKDANGNPMYRNLDKLTNLIAPHCYRVTKAECLDLPPKVYQAIDFELSTEQRKVYDKLYNDHLYLFPDGDIMKSVSFEGIAVRSKLKQITSGFINIYGEPVLMPPNDNPRMLLFRDYLEDLYISGKQFLVWAIYKEEIRQIMAALKEYGIISAAYTGDTSKTDRDNIIDDIASGSLQCAVLQAQAGGVGIEFTKATTSIYYSCSEDNYLRLQSEDRNHRIGTTESVLYLDFLAMNTIDQNIYNNRMFKNYIAGVVLDSDSMNRS
jgi:SNF2 family DNA or RNA helicase